jgi:hypothetical protein
MVLMYVPRELFPVQGKKNTKKKAMVQAQETAQYHSRKSFPEKMGKS